MNNRISYKTTASLKLNYIIPYFFFGILAQLAGASRLHCLPMLNQLCVQVPPHLPALHVFLSQRPRPIPAPCTSQEYSLSISQPLTPWGNVFTDIFTTIMQAAGGHRTSRYLKAPDKTTHPRACPDFQQQPVDFTILKRFTGFRAGVEQYFLQREDVD